MDEKVMMMEQERLAREAKRKRNRKRLRRVSLIVLVFLVIVTILLVVRRNRNEVQENTVQIVVPAGQEVIYAELTGVKGNEITYRMATEKEDTEQTGAEVPRGEELRGGMPDMSRMGGEMPDMSQMEGGMPDMSQMGGQMPDFGGGMFQNGERPEDEESFIYDGVTYIVAGEEITTLIPVGTDVTTKLGAVTTFSRLAAGDQVALVMAKDAEEQIITAVYIID